LNTYEKPEVIAAVKKGLERGLNQFRIHKEYGVTRYEVDMVIKNNDECYALYALNRDNKKQQPKITLAKSKKTGIEYTESDDKNKLEVGVVTIVRPKTLAELLEMCKVDESIWKVKKHIANSWGSVSNPMYQIKAWLERIVPEPVNFPPIHPVHFNIEKTSDVIKPPSQSNLKHALVIPDGQIGFKWRSDKFGLIPLHDRRCWDIILKTIHAYHFDDIILLGDMLDLTDWSTKFVITPEFQRTTQSALYEFGWYLGKLRELAPEANIIYMEGNHEVRLPKKIAESNQASYNLHSIQNPDVPVYSLRHLLNLDALDIQFIDGYPDVEHWLNDNLVCTHGTYSSGISGATTQKVIKDVRSSMIMGHCHKMEMASKTVYPRGRSVSYSAWAFGTISRIDGTVPGVKKKTNWQQGFGMVGYEPGNGLFHIDPISINNGQAMIFGNVVEGKSRINEIYRDTKHEFFKE
jgi:UDP-2,3-diacylglucosamine pyrophosphatase LpxH